jgi:hypothetical protein
MKNELKRCMHSLLALLKGEWVNRTTCGAGLRIFHAKEPHCLMC